MAESVQRVRYLLWKAVGAHMRAMRAQPFDEACLQRAEARLDALMDRLVAAAKREASRPAAGRDEETDGQQQA